MSYKLLRDPLFRLLKAPDGPPPVPPGSGSKADCFQASRRYLMQQLIVWGGGFAAAIIGELFVFFAGGVDEVEILGLITISIPFDWLFLFPIEIAIVLTAAAAVGKYYLIQMDYELRYYIVTDRNVRIRQGVYKIHEATYTFANVQNLSIRQGPVERLFGLSTLVVHTAGGGTSGDSDQDDSAHHRGVLKGIPNPVELRDHIQALLKRYRGTGLGDPDDDGVAASPGGAETLPLLQGIRDELRAVHGLLKG